MPRVQIKQIEPLELNFSDGTVKRAWFTPSAMSLLLQGEGTVTENVEKLIAESKENPYETLSKVLHAALTIEDPKLTLDEAKMILINGGNELVQALYIELVENFNLNKGKPLN